MLEKIKSLFLFKLKEKEEIIDYYKIYFNNSNNFPKLVIETTEGTFATYIDKWQKNEVTFAAPIKDFNFISFEDNVVLPVKLVFNNQVYVTQFKVINRFMENKECLYQAKVLGFIKKSPESK